MSSPSVQFAEASFKSQEVLFNKGDQADKLYLIKSGTIEIFDPDSRQVIAQLKEGDAFGEQAILLGGVRGAAAWAIEDAVCIEVTTEKLKAVLQSEPGIIRPVIEGLLLELAMKNEIDAKRRQGQPLGFALSEEVQTMAKYDPKRILSMLNTPEWAHLKSMENLFLRLRSSDRLNITAFTPGSTILEAGEIPAAGYLVVTGIAVGNDANGQPINYGPGSVIGLSAGIAEQAPTQRVLSTRVVNVLMFPIVRSIQEVRAANPGLKGISRCTVVRVLGLKSPPATLT